MKLRLFSCYTVGVNFMVDDKLHWFDLVRAEINQVGMGRDHKT